MLFLYRFFTVLAALCMCGMALAADEKEAGIMLMLTLVCVLLMLIFGTWWSDQKSEYAKGGLHDPEEMRRYIRAYVLNKKRSRHAQ